MTPFSFADPADMAELTAKALLEVKAVHFRPEDPYKFTSGLASPVYIDCRKLISYPRLRSTLMDFCAAKIMRDIGFESLDAIAGGETAGIPFAAWISERLELPMNYIRKKPKGFGRDAQIEGASLEGQRVLLVEDLTTDGGSKIKFAEAIRQAGGVTNHTIVLFYYDIFQGVQQTMQEIDLKLHYLATWRDVLAVCRRNGYFDEATLTQVEAFLNDPLTWSGNHGGVTEISKAG